MKKCLLAPFIVQNDRLKILLKSNKNKPNIEYKPIFFKFDCKTIELKNFIFNEFNKIFECNMKEQNIVDLGNSCDKYLLFAVNLNNKKIKEFNEDDYLWASYFLRFNDPFISILYLRVIGYINLNNYVNNICPECKRPLKIQLEE